MKEYNGKPLVEGLLEEIEYVNLPEKVNRKKCLSSIMNIDTGVFRSWISVF